MGGTGLTVGGTGLIVGGTGLTVGDTGAGPDWLTLPGYFKENGYLTMGGGKLFHPSSDTENIGLPYNDYPRYPL